MDFFPLLLVSLFTLMMGRARSSNDSCIKVTQCGKGIAADSKHDRVDEICKKTEAALACLHKNLEECENEGIVKAFRESLKHMEEQAKDRCSKQENDGGHDLAAPLSTLGAILLIGCLLLGKLGLMHTSG